MPEKVDLPLNSESVRLHRYLAQCGVASRRKAEEIIQEGRVTVNGSVVVELGTKVFPGHDKVEVDSSPISLPDHVVYLFYKPRGVMTTMDDPQGRPTVAKFLPPNARAVRPVGRLDYETDGLLILTNDGDLAFRLAHPRYGIEKEYVATVQGVPDDKSLRRMANGISIDGKKTSPCSVELVSVNQKKGEAKLKLTLHEGRNRQVRLMCQAINHPVKTLRRVRLGFLTLSKMEPGQMTLLSQTDVQRLRRLVKLESSN